MVRLELDAVATVKESIIIIIINGKLATTTSIQVPTCAAKIWFGQTPQPISQVKWRGEVKKNS